jgi:hypothetical protein
MVEQAARRGDQHVDAAIELLDPGRRTRPPISSAMESLLYLP